MFALALRLIEHETEQEAFDQLYTRYRGLAFWVAKGYHLSDSDAEDAVQDAFFALAENFPNIFRKSVPIGSLSSLL
ncbi:MAG: sigma-70 family RNA polymerase sigma factor [Firmicutes bacterium]|nr:sigma-70 family RNA polymerase sigma factor [Bacillota bacterium]